MIMKDSKTTLNIRLPGTFLEDLLKEERRINDFITRKRGESEHLGYQVGGDTTGRRLHSARATEGDVLKETPHSWRPRDAYGRPCFTDTTAGPKENSQKY